MCFVTYPDCRYKSRTPLPWCNVHQVSSSLCCHCAAIHGAAAQIRLRYPDPTGEYTGFSEEKKQFAGDEFAEIGAEVPEYNGPLLTEVPIYLQSISQSIYLQSIVQSIYLQSIRSTQ